MSDTVFAGDVPVRKKRRGLFGRKIKLEIGDKPKKRVEPVPEVPSPIGEDDDGVPEELPPLKEVDDKIREEEAKRREEEEGEGVTVDDLLNYFEDRAEAMMTEGLQMKNLIKQLRTK